ncbi:MAG: hypothetical protein Q8R02_20670 [Hyphomonadaceae bacterium]|nr:hypothetical protein [Hyphomonadaceae bacterium]
MSVSVVSYRRIALELAALGAADREWLLARLPVEHRNALVHDLLALSKLRLDVAVIRSWNRLKSAASDAVAEGAEEFELIDGLSSRAAAQFLAEWPSDLREAFLGLHDWKWIADLPAPLQPSPLGRPSGLTAIGKQSLVKAVAAQMSRIG